MTKFNPPIYPAAVEIGGASIKLLQLKKAAQGPCEVFKKAYLPLNNTKDSLAALIRDNQIHGSIVTSLPLSKIHSFTFIFPNMPEKDIEQAVLWKLKQNLPAGLALGGISFDYLWSLFSGDNLNSGRVVLVFAVPKETVLERIGLFDKLPVKVIAVEPGPYAALRALHFLKKISPQETTLILTLGSSESSMAIAHRGSMCLIRPLTVVSGNGLTQAIANYHKIDFLKAEGIKRNEGLKDSGSLCRPAVSSQLEGLIVDLEHTFKFFSHQLMKSQGPSSYDRAILCGGPAAMAGLDKFLAEKLGVPVEVFNPLGGAEENAHSFAAAMGMAIRYASNE